ncbi:MAG: methyl-accepting chemotaxis protein [Pantoea sp.]|uniref:Methyl-accepting chemotaxis protein n=1 Tax=Pantoea septica TaxID=472695 RepID=A0ABX3UWI7_9GAMM|nr:MULTISPECIES: methyl-accepting chemotaxis protein [Pantoea]MDU5781145.1 methyl-accepting chemotaxis protein [Pantoea sp.]ORN02586.1 methyl-accepting chemotaxis protein [Pantoea septica]
MFRNLKISRGVNYIVLMFVLLLVASIAIGMYGSITTRDNFIISNETSDNLVVLQQSATSINRGVAQLNAVMLAKSLGKDVDSRSIDIINKDIDGAKSSIEKFMSTPFSTEEEMQAAKKVNFAFNAMLDDARYKMKFVMNPQSYPDRRDQEIRARNDLTESIDVYTEIAGHLNDLYVTEAGNNYQRTLIISLVSLLASVICAVGAYLWLKNILFARLHYAVKALDTIAEGNLSEKIESRNTNEIGEMLSSLENMRLSLSKTISGIRTSTQRIYSSAQEIASGNNDLSSRTEEQASALQQTAASMEELKITVRQNADNAHHARQLADGASVSASRGGEVMTQLDTIMRQIMNSSRQIADINAVIDSIANQTNILALNAAVEAARAGEQGRGFAVVAGEVRNLAKRSADAAKESRELINTCVANMTTGSQQVERASGAMQDIVQSVTQVNDIMAEITSASEEQSMGINQIAQAVNEMDLVTQQNAAMVEQAAVSASSMEAETQNLEKQVAQFKIKETSSLKVPLPKSLQTRLLTVPEAAKKESSISTAAAEDDWTTF